MTESHSLKPTKRFADTSASVLFDLLRGAAALVVVAGHGRHVLFQSFPDVKSHRLLLAVPYLITNAGHQAVILFFVLSGYFVGGAVLRASEKGQWAWSDYLLKRFVRLWVVLIPALFLGLFWDKLGIALGHAPALYHGHVQNNLLPYEVSDYLSAPTFFGNLFFCQNILSHVFGSNGPLWSLANEFWYYILFPLGFLAARPSVAGRMRLLYGVLFVAAGLFVGVDMLDLFPIWLGGTALLVIPPPAFTETTGRRARLVAALVYAPLAVFFANARRIPEHVGDYLFGCATVLFLWILLSANQRCDERAAPVRASRTLARFSYSLYALHTPLLIFLGSLVVGDNRWDPTLAHIAEALAVLAIVPVYAFIAASLTEFHTDALRRRFEIWLRLPAASSGLSSNPIATSTLDLPRA